MRVFLWDSKGTEVATTDSARGDLRRNTYLLF